MGRSYRGFTTVNMSTPKVRQTFVLLILGTAVIFVVAGIFATLQAERSAHSSDLRKITSRLSTETLLYLMGGEIPYLMADEEIAAKQLSMSGVLFELATSVDPKDPRSFLGELPGFALFDTEIAVAGQGVDYTSVPIESAPPEDVARRLAEQNKKSPAKKKEPTEERKAPNGREQVYIYHTHYTESYLPSLNKSGNPNTAYDNQNNVTQVGKHLGKELDRLGIGNIVRTEGYDANWNRLYQASRAAAVQAMKQNRELRYLIDIHRDSQPREKTTKEIRGKSYARISFVIGTANPHWEENEQFARKLHKRLDELYPGLSKGVFRKSRATGNGEYNQSLSNRSILVEIGGVGNTFEEAFRTSEALARAFADLHFEAKPVDGKPGP
ncbi:stage II sporulation protein P [Marinithermofilum abyssi]|uniref:Stage II sporulation protein P n=1 Tax=Marinithermofilum abyssi TaxID=1571185 RepID=A0A8J2Y943_9BACL|nr:stage II sporulation protein P [Marinithermofilum abyssi]GGE14458.1 stage II sporulation protein P [Marinithermofilum abyssi]